MGLLAAQELRAITEQRIKMQRDVCSHQGSNCTFFIGGNVTPVNPVPEYKATGGTLIVV